MILKGILTETAAAQKEFILSTEKTVRSKNLNFIYHYELLIYFK